MDEQENKRKLLEYLEKEYESLGSQIESVTNRAGIAVTLLSGVVLLALENETLTYKTITFLKHTYSAKVFLGVFFFLSIVPLLSVLLIRKRFERLDFVNLYNNLYANPCKISSDSQKFYTDLLVLICNHNEKQLHAISYCYNLSMIFVFVLIFIYLLM